MNPTIPQESVMVNGEVYAHHVAINQNYYHPTGEFIPLSAEDKQQTLLHRWARIVWRCAMSPALEEGDRRVSYAAVNTMANRIAHTILARRLPKDLPVAAFFDIESDLQIGLVAIWKAGNFFVWLEPSHSLAHNQVILEDAGALVVVTNQKHAELARQLWPGEGQVIVIEELADNLPPFDPPITIDATTPAYLMYASTSNDRPEGTLEVHGNLVAMLAVREQIFHFSTHDRVAYTVHGSGWSYAAAAALMYGGTSLAFDGHKEGVARLLPWLKENRVTILPGDSIVRLFLSALDGREEFPTLRVISGDNEPLGREHLMAYQRFLPDSCIMGNFYSATECRSITLLILDKNSHFEGEILPVGFPTLHTDVEIWNERDRPVGVDEVGEIVAFTPYLATGYWKLADLMASRFGVDWQDRRFFRTGDLGRIDEQGCLWILERRHNALRAMGNAVEPAKVETVANQETIESLELAALPATQLIGGVAEDEVAETAQGTPLPETTLFFEEIENLDEVDISFASGDLELTEPSQAVERLETAESFASVESAEEQVDFAPEKSLEFEVEAPPAPVESLELSARESAPESSDLTEIPESAETQDVPESTEPLTSVDLRAGLDESEIFETIEALDTEGDAGGDTEEDIERVDMYTDAYTDSSVELELSEISDTTEIPDEAENLTASGNLPPEFAEFWDTSVTDDEVASLATPLSFDIASSGGTEEPTAEPAENVEVDIAEEVVIPWTLESSEVPDMVIEPEAIEPEAIEPETVETSEIVETFNAPVTADEAESLETTATVEIGSSVEAEELTAQVEAEIIEEVATRWSLETNEVPEAAIESETIEPESTEPETTEPETTELEISEPEISGLEVGEALAVAELPAFAPDFEAEEIFDAQESLTLGEIAEEEAFPALVEEPDPLARLEAVEEVEEREASQVEEVSFVAEPFDLVDIVERPELSENFESPEIAAASETLETSIPFGVSENFEMSEAEALEVTESLELNEISEPAELQVTEETVEASPEVNEISASAPIVEAVETFPVKERDDEVVISEAVAEPEMTEVTPVPENIVAENQVAENPEFSEIPVATEIPEIDEYPNVAASLDVPETLATPAMSDIDVNEESPTGVDVDATDDNEATPDGIESVEFLATLASGESLLNDVQVQDEANEQGVEWVPPDRTFLSTMPSAPVVPQFSAPVQPLSSLADDSEPEVAQPATTEVDLSQILPTSVEMVLPKASVNVNGETVVQHVKLGQQNYHPTGEHVPITPAEQGKTLLHRFGRMVERFDSQPAIEDGNRVLSYVEFNALANRIAHALLGRKHPATQPVAVLCDFEADLYISAFAVWKAGLFFVWLEPDQPLARNKSIVADSGATVVITNRKHADVANQLFSDPLGIYVAEEMLTGYPSYDPDITLQASSPAYLMYPVGIGKLKGVVEVHRNLMEMIVVSQSFLHFSNQERVAHLSSASGWVFALYASLMYGGCLLPYRAKEHALEHLSQWFIEHRITIAIGGAVLRPWLVTLDGSQQFPNLRLVCLDAGASYQQHLQAYQRHLSDRALLLLSYNAVEYQTATLMVIDKSCEIPSRLLPRGFPTAQVSIEIWNDFKRPLPVGITGEIVVFTPFAAQGYWNLPEVTKNYFGVDAKGRRYYRTGELGWLDEQGALWVRGRKDAQVTLRGNRVNLADVEAAMMDVPNVKEVAVIHSSGTDATRGLTAFVLTAAPTTDDEVRREVETRVPSYLVPATVSVLAAFPRTAHGDIDRTLLQEVVARGGKIAIDVPAPAPMPAFRGERARRTDGVVETQAAQPLALPSHFKSRFRIDAVRVMPGTPGNRPLFFCPGGNGSLRRVLRDQKLIRQLSHQRPFYGLVAAASDEAPGLYTNRDELVAASLVALRHIQPQGPYSLIGEGVGGKLAYAMAQLLVKEGEQVALLVLLDAPLRGGELQDGSHNGNWLQRLFRGLRGKSGGQGGKLAAYALQSKEKPVHLAQRRYSEILTKFEPSMRYSAPAVAIFTHQSADHRRRWEKLLPAVKMTVVEGSHEDYLRVSSGKVVGLLRQAMEGTPVSPK